jgi:hypothetical protein
MVTYCNVTMYQWLHVLHKSYIVTCSHVTNIAMVTYGDVTHVTKWTMLHVLHSIMYRLGNHDAYHNFFCKRTLNKQS